MILGHKVLAIFGVIIFMIGGCATSGGVSNLKWTTLPNSPSNLKPNTGDIVVIWKEHGFPIGYKDKKYSILGRVSGRSTWCGIVAPRDNEELHARIIEEAKKHGGNGIVMECGYGSTMISEMQCYCYADVIKFEK